MTTDEKIGQLFVVSFYGDAAGETNPAQASSNRPLLGSNDIADAIARYHLGGVIYFDNLGNVVSPAQLAKLSNSIQAMGATQSPSVPLFVSTDQEGGSIVRLPSPATPFPGNMALGASDDPTLARSTGMALGQEVRAVGINQILAPVGDVNVNPANPIIGLRSFGADPTSVASMTAAMVHGFQDDAGLGATVKHFPGHGDTNVDSHTQLPIINHTAAQWVSTDKPPFSAAIAAGVDMVMVGHLAFPALDPTRTPASLSPTIVTTVLRGQMGFDGVVITDSLQMGALTNTYGDSRIPVMAIEAGDDMLLMPPSLPVAWNAVKAAVSSGEIPMSRLDESVRRILTLKMNLGLFAAPPTSVTAAATALGTKAHKSLEQRDAEASVTLVANDGAVLPLNGASDGSYLVVGPTSASVSVVLDAIAARGWIVGGTVTGTSPTSAAIDNALAHAVHYGTLIDLTLNADTDAGQQTLVRALARSGKRLITVSIGRPYDQGYYRAAVNICLYSDSTASLDALVRVIFGDIAPAGHLPVAIPNGSSSNSTLYPLGFGLGY
ncbi:MAG TPA: glycoside hydrolase family 3 N-terminal domain-containing protein [Candidatus Limnocylindrales bacterium]